MYDLNYLKETITDVFLTDSPSGFFEKINSVLKEKLEKLGYDNIHINNKGNVRCDIKGKSNLKKVVVAAHCDTLGLMVRSVSGDGTLRVTKIGGPIMPTLDGEYCRVYTRDGKYYTGTILCNSCAAHVYKDASSKERNEESIIVRLDEKVSTKADTLALGIDAGCYICYDPKTVITDSGFLKSRFIDDKASCCVILTVLKYLSDNKIMPNYDLSVYFTNHEEVGHGGATILDCDEFLAIDMGCVGLDLNGSEYKVSICAKDSSGPYDYEMTNRLIELSKENKIEYAVDIFPYYGSDVSAAFRAGVDCKGALIGSGVCASHGMERTHLDGLDSTIKLTIAYLTK